MADLAVPPTELAVPPGELAVPPGELAVPPGELAVPPGELPLAGGGPPDRLTDADVELALTRVEELLTRLETVPGPTAEVGLDAVAALTDVYGEALSRVVDLVAAGGASVEGLAADELVGQLMVLHGLHPDPVEQRVVRALAEVAPQLGSGTAELVEVAGGVASITITASGCSSGGLPDAVRDIVLAAAPELVAVNAVTRPPPAAITLIPVEALLHRPGVPG